MMTRMLVVLTWLAISAAGQEWTVEVLPIPMPLWPNGTPVEAIAIHHAQFPHAQPTFPAYMTNSPAALEDAVREWALKQNVVDAANAGNAQAQAVLAQEAAEQEAKRPPTPDTTVPMLDDSGNVVGTVRVLADSQMRLVTVLNSASPQREWPQQRADYAATRAAWNAKLADIRQRAQAIKAQTGGNVTAKIAELCDLIVELTEP